MRFSRLSAYTFVATLLASNAALATTTTGSNLILDGSFEAQTQATGSWSIYSSLAGWTVGAKGVEIRDKFAGAAANGVNFVELDTTANSWISQTVDTVAGQSYVLTFQLANRSSVSLASQGVTVSWGSTVLATSLTSSLSSGWETFTYTVLGDGTATTLTFAAAGVSDSYGSSLDNVALYAIAPAVTAAVPEPETYAMMLGGLGLVGCLARRRKTAA